MVTEEAIRGLSDSIVREFQPDRIVLFGSYAYGTPREDSVVDLLVVMPHGGRPLRLAADIAVRTHSDFALDVIVRSPEELCTRLGRNDFFLREIVEKGRVLHAKPDR